MKEMSKGEFYSALQSNEYGQQYLELIEKVKSENRGLKREVGYELHHIHPKALGGKQDGETVKLSCFEHCTVHVLLAQAIPCIETLLTILIVSEGRVKTLTDLEQVQLNEIYHWSELRLKAFKELGKKHRGRVWITDGQQLRAVEPSQVNYYIGQGWKKGYSDNYLQKLSIGQKGKNTWSKGRIHIHRNSEEKIIMPCEFEKYRVCGWKKGRSEKISLSKSTSGYMWINNGLESKTIPADCVDRYINSGWQKGRSKEHCIKMSKVMKGHVISEETRRKISESHKGLCRKNQTN